MSASVFIPQLPPSYWYKMYCFYYVAYFGSYSKAARVLHIAQPSLSRAVQSLEQRLKTVLLVRSSRHVSLTPGGKHMLNDIKIILDRLKKIENSSKHPPKPSPESMVLWVAEPLLCDYLLKPLLGFQQQRSDLKLALRSLGCVEPMPAAKHQISIALGLELSGHRIQKPLLRFESGLYASQSYLQTCAPPLTLEDLSKHRLLLLNETIPGVFEDMNWHDSILRQLIPHTLSRCRVHSPEHLLCMAATGFGIMAWVKGHPSLEARPLTEILGEVSLLHGPQNQAYFSCESHSFDTEGVQALYLYLKEHFKDL